VISVNLADQTARCSRRWTPREEKGPAHAVRHRREVRPHARGGRQDFEVTRERIRQIEAKALRKLRHPSRSKRLKAFVEN